MLRITENIHKKYLEVVLFNSDCTQAFVSECDVNKEDAAICRAIVALGKSLGLKIIRNIWKWCFLIAIVHKPSSHK
jgi:hypothetical protein